MRHVTRGYTLAEMLVWFAVLFIFMSLVSWFMVSVADTSRRSHRAIEEATVRVMVLGRLGPDVRNASRILDQHAGGKSDDKTLILEKRPPRAGRRSSPSADWTPSPSGTTRVDRWRRDGWSSTCPHAPGRASPSASTC